MMYDKEIPIRPITFVNVLDLRAFENADQRHIPVDPITVSLAYKNGDKPTTVFLRTNEFECVLHNTDPARIAVRIPRSIVAEVGISYPYDHTRVILHNNNFNVDAFLVAYDVIADPRPWFVPVGRTGFKPGPLTIVTGGENVGRSSL